MNGKSSDNFNKIYSRVASLARSARELSEARARLKRAWGERESERESRDEKSDRRERDREEKRREEKSREEKRREEKRRY